MSYFAYPEVKNITKPTSRYTLYPVFKHPSYSTMFFINSLLVTTASLWTLILSFTAISIFKLPIITASWLVSVPPFGYLIGSIVSVRVLKMIRPSTLLLLGIFSSIFSGSILTVLGISGLYPLFLFIPLALISGCANGIVEATTHGIGLQPISHENHGKASGIISVGPWILGGLVSLICSYFAMNSIRSLGLVVLIDGLLMLLIFVIWCHLTQPAPSPRHKPN